MLVLPHEVLVGGVEHAIAARHDHVFLLRAAQVAQVAPQRVQRARIGADVLAGLEWRLMDGAKRWHGTWPPAGVDTPGRPLAAKLTLDVWRDEVATPQSLTRLIPLPAGQGR